jgi:hypothetical protein
VAPARADVVLDWNVIAVNTATPAVGAQNPFFQARTAAIVQLAVFEAVDAITGVYDPYLGTIDAPDGASAEAAAVAAAHRVLRAFFGGSAAELDAARDASLAAIPDGPEESDGIAVGIAAADAMMALRARDGALLNADGSIPVQFYAPGDPSVGVWQPTPSCPVDSTTNRQVGILLSGAM